MSVRVDSALGPYDVHIERGAVDRLPGLLRDADRVALIHAPSVSATARDIALRLEVPVTLIEVPDAERAKTPEVLAGCWDAVAAAGLTRNDLIVGVGGGTTTDLAGFVAATWLRGVAYVSVPTTVLAMVDAAVGGKTGINLGAGKNLVGSFYEPRAVLCDLALLDTLPSRDVRAGLAEVVKCGFIADARILELASEDLADSADVAGARFAELVERAVAVKATVVAVDFREATSTGASVGREALNYGHTLGHAIEAHAHFSWRHGDAISVGMAWVGRVSREILGLPAEAVGLHDELLGGLGLPLRYQPDAYPRLRELMSLDKKARGSRLRLVGLEALGSPRIIDDPPEDVLSAAYRELG
ncbi:3-dehydroquinate synthase [Tessaracoccus sp. MC1679]|uniref:3-dehydroquinate synthase n=1 Tax=Tessaracoccus sp. MC1679 TaxID=2760313 RepID=UPI00160248EF|nr:3-dehydroquinate synthase [Tessaracoccus sp. MC1679]